MVHGCWSYVEMGSCWSEGVIGEEIVVVSLGVVVHGWVKAGMVGHFVEVAVVVECWEEEEGEVEGD